MLNKICDRLTYMILIILIIISGLLLIPRIFGYENFAVISGSMEPNISVGSIVYVKSTDFQDLAKGDVISFFTNETTRVTHRIIEIDQESESVITQGDANNVRDADAVTYQHMIGKVAFTIPFLGYLSMYIRTPLGIALICTIIFILILLHYLPEIFEQDSKTEDSPEQE